LHFALFVYKNIYLLISADDLVCADVNEPSVTFHRPIWTTEEPVDYINDFVAFQRDSNGCLFNILSEDYYVDYNSPLSTRWSPVSTAKSTLSDYISFGSVTRCDRSTNEDMIGNTYSMLAFQGGLMSFYDVTFSYWTAPEDGAGVEYQRQLTKLCAPRIQVFAILDYYKTYNYDFGTSK
jgi:hypothetical protein